MMLRFRLILLVLTAGIAGKAVQAQEAIELITYGDSITAGLIKTTNGGSSADCPPGVSLDESLSGSGNLRCFGYGAEGVGGYQPELKQSLESLGYDISIYNYGYSGIATALMKSLINTVLNEEPNSDYVLLMGGANDVFLGVSTSTVKSNLQSMVNSICSKGMVPVLATVTRNYISTTYRNQVSTYNNAIRQIDTDSSNCNVIPAEQYYALSSGSDYGNDGLHLSSQGNTKMAAEWLTALAISEVLRGEFLPAILLLLLDD